MTNVECISKAIDLMRQARELLVAAEAKRTLIRLRATLRSADGARRNARLKPFREARRGR